MILAMLLGLVQASMPFVVRGMQGVDLFPSLRVAVVTSLAWIITFFYTIIMIGFCLIAMTDFRRRHLTMVLMKCLVKRERIISFEDEPDLRPLLDMSDGGDSSDEEERAKDAETGGKQTGADSEEVDPMHPVITPHSLQIDLALENNILSWASARRVLRQFGMHYRYVCVCVCVCVC
jgi:hypothetical protein